MNEVGATTPIPGVLTAARGRGAAGAARGGRAPAAPIRALGALGLLGVLTTVLLLSADAAAKPSEFVPARSGGWPGWLAGPLAGLGAGLGKDGFQTLMLVMCASYALVLLSARALPLGALAAGIVAAHVILFLGPPLISQDVFGYLAFARLGALHGLDPYTHTAAQASTDAVYPFLSWVFQHSPYGPLFTLASYATAPLGLAGGLWVLKAFSALCSLGAIALIARAAARAGHSARWAAAFVGLNPVVLVLAVGGAHNDTLLLLLLAVALALTAGTSPRWRAAASVLVAGVAVKVTAGLALPFVVLAPRRRRERMGALRSAALTALVLALLAVIGFGVHAFGFLDAVNEQQQLVATHSVPAETARLFGLSGTPGWWRHLFVAAFLVVLCVALWRTARGADWRVAAGWTTLALLLSTAWLLPWYAIWPLPLAAVSGDRRLRAASLVFCVYAVLIHLPLANPLLSPATPRVVHQQHPRVPGLRHDLELTGFQVLRDAQLDLRW